jgi:hypothetical protein
MLKLITLLGLSRLRGSRARSEIDPGARVRSTPQARTVRDHAIGGGPFEIIPGNGDSPTLNRTAAELRPRARAQEALRLSAVDRALAEIVASHRRKWSRRLYSNWPS